MKLIRFFIPPDKWRFPVILALGVFWGLFCFAFYISKAPSYLSDKPETCVNCHIMAPQYATWTHSSHRQYTHCNDCHVPHNNILIKYFFKAKDGMRHSALFTLRLEPQVIHIREAGQKVVQDNCIRCHTSLLIDESIIKLTQQTHHFRTEKQCWSCHRETPHGQVNSLASVPYARVPLPESPVPDWLKQIIKNKK
ncbi:MAG: cytochrome c nitrite reductase small subunit [Bacteroidota bacterium]